MNIIEFTHYISDHYNCEMGVSKSIIRYIERLESKIEVLLENEVFTIYKDYHSCKLRNRNGENEILHFCVYGIGFKDDITSDDDFENFERFDYIIL